MFCGTVIALVPFNVWMFIYHPEDYILKSTGTRPLTEKTAGSTAR
jgi:hypothetical protein